MNEIKNLEKEHTRIYNDIAALEIKKINIKNQIQKIKTEIIQTEKQWKKDTSQREYAELIPNITNSFIKPMGKNIGKITKKLYRNTPSREENAITYAYIQSLKNDLKSLQNDMNSLTTDQKEKQIILRMLQSEINLMKRSK